jgi:predicted nuclease of predicted toxin-antitoxin system
LAKLTFYVNESVNVAVAEGLKRRGVKVISARDASNLGLSDKEQLEYAKKKNLVIVTHDDDFLSMAMKFEHKGIVYVHQQKYRVGYLIRRLKLLWDIAKQKDMVNHVEFL